MKIKNRTIGAGRPLICVPVVETEQDGIFKEAEQAVSHGAEVLEWRMDWFAQVEQWNAIEAVLNRLAEICREVILLCTFRSSRQGGQREIAETEYVGLLQKIADSRLADLVDVEVFELSDASAVIGRLHGKGQRVIGSQHYFSHTPETTEMQQELGQMRKAGADIGKLAVMPGTPMDVLRLLEATARMKEKYPDYPLVTMAMGGLGAVSRVSGQVFGSCMTFASVGKASAPGQLPIEDVTQMLEKIAESMEIRDET